MVRIRVIAKLLWFLSVVSHRITVGMGSLIATTVVLVVTVFQKLQNLAYTFVASFPTDLPS